MGAYLQELGKSISFGRLSLMGKVLWPMLLAASDDQGRGLADADVLKWTVCPNVAEITIDDIPTILDEMVAQKMIVLYEDSRGRAIYQIINWWVHQKRRFARPSLYDAPEGWTDRVRLQQGRKQTLINWDQPGGFIGQESLPEPETNSGKQNNGQYGGQYGEQYEGQHGGPELNRSELNQPKPPPPTPPEGGGGGGDSLGQWLEIYEQNITEQIRPAAREQIETVFRDPHVNYELWSDAIGIAVANNQLKLSYVLGVIRKRRNGSGPGPPATGKKPIKLTGSLPGRGRRDEPD